MDAVTFDNLVGSLGAAGAVAQLAEESWGIAGDGKTSGSENRSKPIGAGVCVAAVSQAKSLACPAREVRTVAAYHNVMSTGGAERVCAHLARVWHSMGLRVVLFSDVPREECAYALPEGVEWVQLPESFAAWHVSYGPRAEALAAALQEHKVDAFVYHQWWNPLLPWDMLLCKASGVSFVGVMHNIFKVMFYEPHPNEFDVPRILGAADGVVVLSEYDKRFWERFNPRVWQTNNPATLDVEAAPCSSLSGEDVVWVGRLSLFDKQPQEAIEIMAHVVPRHPSARLVLVGPGSEDDVRYLKDLARERGIAENVVFTGAVEDAGAHYLASAVHLLTSKLDGWCLVLAESKAHGLPCVMYEMPYLTTTQGNRGIVAVAQDDREGAAAAVCTLLEDEGLRRQLGSQAREHALDLASFDLAALWASVFSEVGEGSAPRTASDRDDALWDMVVDGFKIALEKAQAAARPAPAEEPGSRAGLLYRFASRLRR